jgi:Fis family transcriptional regulator, factor for inversion stimulation protein
MRGQKNEIADCVRLSVEKYLQDLDGESPCPMYEMVIRNVEKPLIEVVLAHAEGNQTIAADMLGINRNTLRKKMLEHKIK